MRSRCSNVALGINARAELAHAPFVERLATSAFSAKVDDVMCNNPPSPIVQLWGGRRSCAAWALPGRRSTTALAPLALLECRSISSRTPVGNPARAAAARASARRLQMYQHEVVHIVSDHGSDQDMRTASETRGVGWSSGGREEASCLLSSTPFLGALLTPRGALLQLFGRFRPLCHSSAVAHVCSGCTSLLGTRTMHAPPCASTTSSTARVATANA